MRVAIAWISTLLSCGIAVLVLFANAMKTAPNLDIIEGAIAGAAPATLIVLLGISAAQAIRKDEWPKAAFGFILPLLCNLLTLLLVVSSLGPP